MAIVRRGLDPKNPPKLAPERRARLAAMTPEAIERNAAADPDNPPMTGEEAERVIFARTVREARARLGMSQPVFAERFHIALARLRDWEQARHQTDSVAAAYIKTILSNPKAVEKALQAEDASRLRLPTA